MDCNNTTTFSSNNKHRLDNQSLEGLSFTVFIHFRSSLLTALGVRKDRRKIN